MVLKKEKKIAHNNVFMCSLVFAYVISKKTFFCVTYSCHYFVTHFVI